MKILLIAIGSRGDVEPFLAIGEMLQKKGEDVLCIFPEQFRDLAANSGLRFEGLTHKFLDLIESPHGKIVMGGGGSIFKKIGAFYKIYKESIPINNEMLIEQHDFIKAENPDRIIYSSKATYPVLWEIQHPGKTTHVSPIPYLTHYVKSHAHIGFNGDYGAVINKFTYWMLNKILVKNIVSSNKMYLKKYGIQAEQISEIMLKKKMVYTISPVFFPEQSYWPRNVKVLGYHERIKTQNWKPSQDLEHFIANRPKILFVTFGSMTNPEPEEKTRIILDIVEQYQIPTIINTAAGGLAEPESYNRDLVMFVGSIPYEWILPKMHAVMHHGGSGTTHLAVKYGCAAMIIPHIMDQHIWNDMNTTLGDGPKGIPVHKIAVKKLAPLVLDLYQSSTYKQQAEILSAKMQKEDFEKELYLTIME